jgi:hypothetical protein
MHVSRLLLGALVAGLVSLLVSALLRPAAIGVAAGLLAAAWVTRIEGPSDGALVCSVAAIPIGLYFGLQVGQTYPLAPDQSRLAILLAGPILGALGYAAAGSLFGAVLGLIVRLFRHR